jgi:hypothetical protein
MQVLACDISGTPFDWISSNDAATYYASKKVAWDIGDIARVYRGGTNRDGDTSLISIRPVIAIASNARKVKILRHVIPLGDGNRLLFARDRNTCVYCGDIFPHSELSRDHILPKSKNGEDTWTNCVTACRRCNQAKADKFVHDFKPLLYVPYEPCRYEHYLLSGRNVIADQHDYLAAKLPKHSRFF